MVWTGDGKVLIAWDSGQGPTFLTDPLGKPLGKRALGECEVWRAIDTDAGGRAVCIGRTRAEAFLDSDIEPGSVAVYWIMERMEGGGRRQIGPTIDVEVPVTFSANADVTPPSVPDRLRARRHPDGNLLSWLPSSDDESGLLAYLVYGDGGDQPDAVLWANEAVQEGSARRATWLDEEGTATSCYAMRAIDKELNLSGARGKTGVDGEVPDDDPDKGRDPVTPVTPEGGPVNYVPNPDFADNIDDGWVTLSTHGVRDASPPASLPDECAAAARLTPASTNTHIWTSEYYPIETGVRDWWASCHLYRPGGYRTVIDAVAWSPTVGVCIVTLYDGSDDDAAFVRQYQGFELAEDADRVLFHVTFYDCVAGDHEGWVTGFMLQPDYDAGDDPAGYGDGDSDGWAWDGDVHNSASRLL